MALDNKKFELSPRLKLGVGRGYSQNKILKLAAIACLVLAIGLTVNAVGLIFKNKGQASADSYKPQVLGANDIQTNNNTGTIEFTTYTVLKGDTLFNISKKLDIGWSTLATLNNLKSPFYLKPGQSIKVPKK